jgi:hypothetical protein
MAACSNVECPRIAELVRADLSERNPDESILDLSLRDLSRDKTGRYWCKHEDCQRRYRLMNYGERIGWKHLDICPGYGLPPTEELWRTALMLSRKEVIDVYYRHLIGSAEDEE